MTTLNYSLLANNSIPQYRFAAIGQHTKDSLNNNVTKRNNDNYSNSFYFNLNGKVEITNTIGQLSSKAYTELRGQQTTVTTEDKTVEINQDYWGSEQTASRILDTAKGLSDGNSENLNIIIDAVKKGFNDAQYTSGGKLPEVSLKTRETVLAELDSWAESLNR